MIKKKLIVTVSLVSVLVIAFWFGWQYSSPVSTPLATAPDTVDAPDTTTAADVVKVAPPAPLPKPVLNLEIPAEHFLMDSAVEVPENQSWLEGLFKPRQKEKSVKMGGSLILDEKPADPNAAIWDQVKGAEVGITIQTP